MVGNDIGVYLHGIPLSISHSCNIIIIPIYRMRNNITKSMDNELNKMLNGLKLNGVCDACIDNMRHTYMVSGVLNIGIVCNQCHKLPMYKNIRNKL